jgi:hypothetical protein
MKDGIRRSLYRAILIGVTTLLCSAQLNSVGIPIDLECINEAKVEAGIKEVKKNSKPIHNRKKVSSWVRGGEFLGFQLQKTRIDTTVTEGLKAALLLYSGPAATISSLKRHYNCKSDHYHGNAVDFAWCDVLINYLISDEGQAWVKAHGLYFFIEGRPGSRKVAAYLKNEVAAKHVFFNPNATGNHIHLGVE